ncbi:MAG TPA: hypothetical protein VHQ64_00155 [Pyrinomonadaceae bacterium]|nr:hypothetical protein [Pyrinomonadaceae bacterium]
MFRIFLRLCRRRAAIAAGLLIITAATIASRSKAKSHFAPDVAPRILLDESGPDVNQAAAFEATCLVRDPFHLVSQYPWFVPANDQNTRVTVFVTNVVAGSQVTITLVDARGQISRFGAENILDSPGNAFSQMTFRLPGGLAPGPCSITVTNSAGVSNAASFRVAFESNYWRQDLQSLATQLPVSHVNAFTRISRAQFDQMVADLDRDIPSLQDHEIVARMMQIVASIGDAHTTLSSSGSLLRFRTYPIKTYWFTDGLYVTSVASSYPQALGKKLTRFGTQTSSEANTKVATVISHENDAWLNAQAPAQFSSPEILQALRVFPGLQSGAFEVQGNAGGLTTVDISAVGANQTVNWLSLPDPAQTPTPLYRQHPELNYWFDYVASARTVYFQYNVCQNRADLPFNQFLQQMQQFVGTHQTDKLVIDLRNNSGGDSSILQPLINALATDPGFNRSDRLFVITGRLTISSGLLNAISLRQQTHGTFVGEATGGKPNHFGEVGSFRLPNSQLLVTYAKKFFSTVSGDPASLFPDTTIELSAADYFAGRDPVLENILNR